MKSQFEYEIRKNIIDVYWNSRIVKTMKGKEADDFLCKLPNLTKNEINLVLAKLTGNFRRGNERNSKNHMRNKE